VRRVCVLAFNSLLRDQRFNNARDMVTVNFQFSLARSAKLEMLKALRSAYAFNSLLRDQSYMLNHLKLNNYIFQFSLARSDMGRKQRWGSWSDFQFSLARSELIIILYKSLPNTELSILSCEIRGQLQG
jgi:hypothetical protein